ncbi:hypothetical protein BESB_023080 [Besnoitia besnoiti]|uniref:Secreted protein n=1 Tax=Besnoitia besnoiti TaxID=94643 RepID=A0A2A9M7E7_BESBE|nr:hypothetical protein BESB_023080 [Besnoitia besnoiti]PFH31816.1 hypothetical protein BESB_023080 [Besnoitia besnoiti]
MQLPRLLSWRSLTVATFCSFMGSGVAPDTVECRTHESRVLPKLGPLTFPLTATPRYEGTQKAAQPSEFHFESREEFLHLFLDTLNREFNAEDGGLPALFMGVALEPALKRSASVASLKKQMRAFADLMGSDGLGPEDQRLRTILEVFSSYPVTERG